MTLTCRVCGNDGGNRKHRAREMMFGTRDEFDYFECARCGTLQIAEIPELARYYPAEYYSLNVDGDGLADSFKINVAARVAGFDAVRGGKLRRFLPAKLNDWADAIVPKWLLEPELDLKPDSRILDVGSGGGALLFRFRRLGFRNLLGADAFIDGDVEHPNGVRIVKRTLEELEPSFDLVMLHHSFEHLVDPVASIRDVARLVARGGSALVRIPLKAYAWEKYGVDWVQLDAPRHLYLFTEKGFCDLAESAGFEVVKVVYDSSAFQFYASEEYSRDIAMNDERSYKWVVEGSIFKQSQIDEWEREADKLNAERRGDQACFYLKKR